MRYRRILSLGLIVVGVFMILFQALTITGAVVLSEVLFRGWSVVGLGLVMVGAVFLILDKVDVYVPEHLYCYVPNECMSRGIEPGGWDPNEQVVPAFDPKRFSPEKIRDAFDVGSERSLVEVVGDSKEKFHPRLTGPGNNKQGIYGCESYVPAKDLKVVGEDDWF